VGTVSHVITGSVQVSATLRSKVQAAIEELDYHPNHVARSLKTSRTRTLGIVVPDLTISFFPQIIRGAETAARERGYTLIAVNSTDDTKRETELLSLLRSQRVEGILLIMAADPTPPAQMARVIDSGIPLVCLDRIPEGIAVDSVSVDDVAAAEMGVGHLISMGYRRIAIVTGPLSLKNERRRLLGYKRCCKRAGVLVDKHSIWPGNLRTEDVATLCRKRLQSAADRPDALFCTNGPTALGALEALGELGLETPGDIGFVTFDELTAHDVFTPAITTIVQPAYEIGYQAAEILLRRIDQGKEPEGVYTVRLPATLKVRATSSNPRLLRQSQDLRNDGFKGAG
jgi:DNA-binding LacI/PurR family transcriptional regulator